MYYPILWTTVISFIGGATPAARFLGHRGVVIFSATHLALAFFTSTLAWYEVAFASCEVAINFKQIWFEIGSFQVSWNVFFDLLTANMLFTVTSVSLAVHLFAIAYMRGDPHLTLFMSYLSLFTFFMIILVSSDNLVMMLVGWEGIGVCSYLLIGYWSHRLAATKSAQKAILVNRVSDGMLLWGILWIWFNTGTLEYDLILMNSAPTCSAFLGLSILIGAMGKSAQILFHVWLADAMEGPTPVSALIHAATLVTAGIYLMTRLSPFWDDVVIIIGAFTAFMAGIFGFFQADIKRVIAFSTCSQLGYMMVAVGLGEMGAEASMCHLMTHASFKAALFLGAGGILMGVGGNQHMARYGSLNAAHCSALCFLTLMIGSLCLVGFPESSGFYSKEVILNLSYNFPNPISDYSHTILLIAALITCCYTAKMFFQAFMLDFSGYNFNITPLTNTKNPWIAAAMSILIIDILLKIWMGTNLLSQIIVFIPWSVKNLPAGLIIAGILSATAAIASKLFSAVRFSATRWGFDQLYSRILITNVLNWGRVTWSIGDKGLFIIRNI